MNYTARFDEEFSYLDGIASGVYSTEQNTGYIDISLYNRVVVIIDAGTIGTNVAADIEIATDASESNARTLKSLSAQTTEGVFVINVRGEELVDPDGTDTPNFSHLNVELTPSGEGNFSVQVWGYVSRYEPVPNDNLGAVVA